MSEGRRRPFGWLAAPAALHRPAEPPRAPVDSGGPWARLPWRGGETGRTPATAGPPDGGPSRCWLGVWTAALLVPLLAALPPLAATPAGQLLAAADSQLAAGALRLRGVRPAPPQPLILAIDAESLVLPDLLSPQERAASPLLRAMGPWPWPRALQAELAAWVLERGAERVVFNIVHSQPSRFGAADDEAFAARLAPWRDRLVLAVSFERSQSDGLERRRLTRPPLARAWPQGRLPRLGFTTVLQSPQGLSEAIPGRAWQRDNLAGFALPWPPPLPYALPGASLPEAPLVIDLPGPAGTIASVPAWRLPLRAWTRADASGAGGSLGRSCASPAVRAAAGRVPGSLAKRQG